jgi:hypothetical protein
MADSARIFFNSLRSAADVVGLVGRGEELYFEASVDTGLDVLFRVLLGSLRAR